MICAGHSRVGTGPGAARSLPITEGFKVKEGLGSLWVTQKISDYADTQTSLWRSQQHRLIGVTFNQNNPQVKNLPGTPATQSNCPISFPLSLICNVGKSCCLQPTH